MKRFFSVLSIVLSALFMANTATAQKGDAAIGLRGTPDGGGFTIKAFMTEHLAFEGQLNAGGVMGLEGESFNAVALLQVHIPLPDPSWRLYFGGGFHGGAWDHGRWYHEGDGDWVYDRAEPIFGMDAVGGVEYVFKSVPIGLSADIKPAINFRGGGPDFFPHNMFGLGFKYYFSR